MTKMMRTTKSNKKVIEEANRDKAKSFFFFCQVQRRIRPKDQKVKKKKEELNLFLTSSIWYAAFASVFFF